MRPVLMHLVVEGGMLVQEPQLQPGPLGIRCSSKWKLSIGHHHRLHSPSNCHPDSRQRCPIQIDLCHCHCQ